MRSICSVQDCAQFVHGHGFCGMHYQRLRNHGTLEIECVGQSRPGARNGMFGSSRAGGKGPFYGRQHTAESKKQISQQKQGRSLTQEHKEKIRESVPRGSDSPHWRGGVTSVHATIRNSVEYKEWRKLVYERDGYTCVLCGDDTSGNLEADHIQPFALYPDLRFEPDNGRTLCRPCHRQHGWNLFRTNSNPRKKLAVN